MGKLIAFLLLILVSSPSWSKNDEAISIILGGWSHHFSKSKFNESHDSVGIEFTKKRSNGEHRIWSLQTFKNRFNYRSYLLGYGKTQRYWFHKSSNVYCEGGYALGFLHSRYYSTINTPIVLPLVGCGVGFIGIKVTVIPEFSVNEFKNPTVVFGYLTADWRF